MFAVIKRFMFSIRRAVWLRQSESRSDVCQSQMFDTETTVLIVRLYHNKMSSNKYAELQLHVQPTSSQSGTGWTYVDVHDDGYKVNPIINSVRSAVCLHHPDLFCPVGPCGAVRRTRGGGAVNVKNCCHTTTHSGLQSCILIHKKITEVSKETYLYLLVFQRVR